MSSHDIEAEEISGRMGATAVAGAQWKVPPQELVPSSDDRLVESTAPVIVPTPHGKFAMRAWAFADGTEHLSATAVPDDYPTNAGAQLEFDALIRGSEPHAVRVHSECATGDLFGSLRCDCGPQLEQGLDILQGLGGTMLYIRNHEGRGIGLTNKLRAYALQDVGLDTVDANLALGLAQEARDFRQTAVILKEMGLTHIRLVTNNPFKKETLEGLGITVDRLIPDEIEPNVSNQKYLNTKRDRMSHKLSSS